MGDLDLADRLAHLGRDDTRCGGLVRAGRAWPRATLADVPALEDVRAIALALPGAEERQGRSGVQWRVAQKLFVWERALRASELRALAAPPPPGPILAARVEHLGAKEALLAEQSGVYFSTPHFDGHPSIL